MRTPFSGYCLGTVLLVLAFLFLTDAGSAMAGDVEAPGAAIGGATAAETQILRYGVHVSAMGTLDPHCAAGSQDRALADMVFNGLVRYQPGNAPAIEPDLALAVPEFEMIDGRQVWTVQLRRGLMFHAGPLTDAYELTAEDVVYSFRKSADAAHCAYAGEYAGLSFEAVDPYTVRIIADPPLSPILFFPRIADYAGGFIVSRRAVEAMGYDGFAAHPVGTGPFVFQNYQPGGKLVLAAHDQYFRGRPQLDGVELHFLADEAARETGLRRGGLDVIVGSGEPGWAARLADAGDLVVEYHGVGEAVAIYLNTRLPPLDDIRVRRAITHALDRNAFLDISDRQLTGAIYSPVPEPFLPGGLDRETVTVLDLPQAPDLEKARQLMAAAGHAAGFTLDLVSSEKRLYRRCYEVLQDQLAAIGIVCNIHVVPHAEMHRRIRGEPQPLVVYTAWRPNADTFLTRFFHSSAIPGSVSPLDCNFSNTTRIDMLIEAARREIVPARQVNLWMQAQIRLLSDGAVYPLMYTRQCTARHNRVVYGHPLKSTMALYPQFTEQTHLKGVP